MPKCNVEGFEKIKVTVAESLHFALNHLRHVKWNHCDSHNFAKSIRSIQSILSCIGETWWKDIGLIWSFNGLVDIQSQMFTSSILFYSSGPLPCATQDWHFDTPEPDLSNTGNMPSLPLLSYLGQLPSSWLPLGWSHPQFGRESHHWKALLFLNRWPWHGCTGPSWHHVLPFFSILMKLGNSENLLLRLQWPLETQCCWRHLGFQFVDLDTWDLFPKIQPWNICRQMCAVPYFPCNQRYKGLPVLTNSNHWWCYERNLPNHFHEEMNKGMMMAFGAIRAAECVKGQWDVVMTLCNSAWLMVVGYSGWMRCRFIDTVEGKHQRPPKLKITHVQCSFFCWSLIILDHES